MNRHLDLLLNGEAGTELDKEYSVSVKFLLSEFQERWAVFGADLHTLAGRADIPTEELLHVPEDSHEFGARVKELVDAIYDVYGEALFSAEELHAVTLLSHERAHIEEMRKQMVFAAVVPEEKSAHKEELAKLSGVFEQTMDVLIRNGPMFGVVAPPSPEAMASLELVEEHWKPKAALIVEIDATVTSPKKNCTRSSRLRKLS